MFEFMIMVPVCAADDKGNPIPTQRTPFDDIAHTVAQVSGGCTVGPVHKGHWFGPGNVLISEKVRPVYFALAYLPSKECAEDKARELARAVKILLNQKCVYLRLPCGMVEFI